MSDYYLITFKNTHGAISGEKVLKGIGFEVTVMPTPTSITKSCGISLRIKIDDFDKVYRVIRDGIIEVENIYLKEDTGYKIIDI